MSLRDTLKIIQGIADKNMIDRPYVVGGLPRDIILGIPNVKTADVDLTTNSADVLRLGVLVASHFNVTFELSDDGHITVFADEFDIDFSSHFISEKVIAHLKGSHSGYEEAFSRDFTINALHQDLVTGEIVDPTELGLQDIKDKVIRTPVPPKLTLEDDPRRAYRAINLAARYGFDISAEIKEFVLDNPEVFSSESVKDKYIAVKIGKALKENKELTLKLLKEMNLFKNVPLSGHFKEVLIEDKLLADYLGSNAVDDKFAFVASSWEQYTKTGPAYQKLADWWASNFQKMPGDRNSSYQSWTRWYMDKYRSDWNRSHKSPEDTLSAMKKEISTGWDLDLSAIPSAIKERKDKLLSFFPKEDDVSSRKEERAKDYPTTDSGKVSLKPGVNIDNVTPEVKLFIETLGNTASELGVTVPIITSGWRSVKSQASLMGRNWNSNGGMNGGREYLVKIYANDSFAHKMADIFEQHGIGPEAIAIATEVVKNNSGNSNHLSTPAKAVDIAVTSGIKEVLDRISSSGAFDMKIVDETNTAGPHYHITIKDQNPVIANIIDRKERLKKIGTTNNY